MDWAGRQPDQSGSSGFGSGYCPDLSADLYPANMSPQYYSHVAHAHQENYCNPNQNQNYYDLSANQNYYSSSSYQNDVNFSAHQDYYSSDYFFNDNSTNQNENYQRSGLGNNQMAFDYHNDRNPEEFPKQQYVPPAIAPRVHINPNFKPKSLPGSENDASSFKAGNVYVNPHWKGRSDSNLGSEHVESKVKSSTKTSSKSTIFVNPKVLGHIKMKPFSHPESTLSKMNDEAIHSVSIETGDASVFNQNRNLTPKNEDEKIVARSKSTGSQYTSDPAFVVLSSTKLVRNSSVISYDKKSNATRSVKHQAESVSRKVTSSPIIKMAKLVSSKYKLVRNLSSSPSASKMKGPLSNPYKRSRKKSVSCKISATSRPNSIYKFVRKHVSPDALSKPSVSTDSVDIVSSTLSAVPGTSTNPPSKTSRKSVKTKYKLVKIPSISRRDYAESKKSGTFRSRFKLVHMNQSSSKYSLKRMSPSKKQLSAGHQFPLSTFHSSRFKLTRKYERNKFITGRNVTRFGLASPCTSKQKNKTDQNIWKLHKYDSSLANLGLQKRGFYGNIIWQKGRNLNSASPYVGSYASFSRSFRVKNNSKPANSDVTTHNSSYKSLLNIGGVFYRSTRTSLARAQPGKPKERILSIRGKRFVLDGKGTTLRPAPDESKELPYNEKRKILSISRVDIGGVTFTRRSDNTLVRTNTHYARNILSIAKMRSIALLTDKLRKNNQPCLIYHRFGKCHAHTEGRCWRVHNPQNIAVCRKFLQGSCELENCLLSHNVGPEKMPTCKYFLEGCCVRDSCPYLHVKLSASAAICQQFLHGYCEAGDQCKKRHVFECPNFDRDGKCTKGKYCPFPHRLHSEKVKGKKGNTNKAAKYSKYKDISKTVKAATSEEGEKRMRYYDDSATGGQSIDPSDHSTNIRDKEISENEAKSEEDIESERDGKYTQINRRPKLGILPAFIPLD